MTEYVLLWIMELFATDSFLVKLNKYLCGILYGTIINIWYRFHVIWCMSRVNCIGIVCIVYGNGDLCRSIYTEHKLVSQFENSKLFFSINSKAQGYWYHWDLLSNSMFFWASFFMLKTQFNVKPKISVGEKASMVSKISSIQYISQHKKASNHHANLPLEMCSFTL